MDFTVIQPSDTSKILLHDVQYDRTQELFAKVQEHACNLDRYKAITNEKRKVEWLSIRALLIDYFKRSVDITYNDQDRPFLVGSNHALSLSHSFEKVAIYFKEEEPVGIDIQKLTPKVDRIKNKFLSDEEIIMLNTEDIALLTLYWSIKEAAFKAYGINDIFLKDNIDILKFDLNSKTATCKVHHQFYNAIFHLEFDLVDNYSLAYIVNS